MTDGWFLGWLGIFVPLTPPQMWENTLKNLGFLFFFQNIKSKEDQLLNLNQNCCPADHICFHSWKYFQGIKAKHLNSYSSACSHAHKSVDSMNKRIWKSSKVMACPSCHFPGCLYMTRLHSITRNSTRFTRYYEVFKHSWSRRMFSYTSRNF